MPDAFGFETPQETQDRIRQRFNDRANAMANLSRGTSQHITDAFAIGTALAPAIERRRDTVAARKDEALRLQQEEGYSRKEAKELARESIDSDFAGSREARRLKVAATDSFQLVEDYVEQGMDRKLAQSEGLLNYAVTLRRMGLPGKANEVSIRAVEMRTEREAELAEVEAGKAGLRATRASADLSEAKIGDVGQTQFTRLLSQREAVIARLENPDTKPEARPGLMRMRGALDAKVLRDTAISLSDADLKLLDRTALRGQVEDLANNEVLLANLGMAEEALDNVTFFESSFLGKARRDLLGFLETTFGREPSESDSDFINRLQAREAIPTIIAAEIRHALTGAQMSEFEIVYLTPFLPAPGDSISQTRAKINAFRAYTKLDSDTRTAMIEANNRGEGALLQFFSTHGGREKAAAATAKTSRDDSVESGLDTVEALIEERSKSRQVPGIQ